MCIICVSPAGIDLPEEKEIKYMFKNNPDGAGFALQGDIYGDGRFLVEYHKGFMNVDDYIEALGPREKLKNLTVVLHMRIKTHGKVDQSTTHPFPLVDNYGALKKLNGSSAKKEEISDNWNGAVLFHNGAFSDLGGIIDQNSSDTQDFVVGVANRYLKNAKMPSKISQKIMGIIISSCRVLVLYPKKNFPSIRFGQWYEHKGCLYSNMGYYDETKTTTYSSYGYYHEHDIDEYGCNVSKYAWPNMHDNWIRFSDSRWRTIKSVAKDEVIINGKTHCKFTATKNKDWILDEANKQIYTPEMEEEVEERKLEERYLLDCYDEDKFFEENGYMFFNDENELLEFCEIAKTVGPFDYIYKGKHWFLDTINYEAFTEEGLKYYFEPGQIGHIRKQLLKNGYFVENQNLIPMEMEKF